MKIKFTYLLLTILFALFMSCNSPKSGKENTVSQNEENEQIIEIGSNVASATFAALSSKLQKVMKEEGRNQAIRYCNLNAIPITDSLAQVHNVKITRISDKWRNPENKASSDERQFIDDYERLLANNEVLEPRIRDYSGGVFYYAPILTQGLCLQCHGDVSTISDYELIKQLYPDDRAIGYNVGEIRGLWKIQFTR